MKLSTTKQIITITRKFIDSNYFFDLESIETQISNRDNAAKHGQDVSMYPDQLIKCICLKNSFRRSIVNTALPLFNAINSKDKAYLTDHVLDMIKNTQRNYLNYLLD